MTALCQIRLADDADRAAWVFSRLRRAGHIAIAKPAPSGPDLSASDSVSKFFAP